MDRLVVIGEIVRPHGLRGDVRVTPLSDDPARFESLDACVVWDAERDIRETRRITAARRQGGAVVVALAGCDSVEAARALAGRLIAVPEAEARKPSPGHFYPWQLAGCRVTTEDGHQVGQVTGIERSPAHDLWVVADGARQHLVPAVPEIVIEVDLVGRRVVIRPPQGLLEL
jgi:16S rRNA processing protein RimM